MNNYRSLLCICFCAGLLGAFASSDVAWMAAAAGLPQWCGVNLVPEWTADWIYPRLIFGGLWGLVYSITVSTPRTRTRWMRKGLWVSLLPSAWQLFYTYPSQTSFGIMGLGLGTLTPVFVVCYNLVWGAVTGIFARALWGRSR
jgi:hypothetical protein